MAIHANILSGKQVVKFTNRSTTTKTTTKPFPTKWSQLHGSNDVVLSNHKPYL